MAIAEHLQHESAPAGLGEGAPSSWAYPYDDGDPHYLPESELVAPLAVPGWAYRRVAR